MASGHVNRLFSHDKLGHQRFQIRPLRVETGQHQMGRRNTDHAYRSFRERGVAATGRSGRSGSIAWF